MAMNQLLVDFGKRKTSWLLNLAGVVLPIARYHLDVPNEHYVELAKAKRRLSLKHQGINMKNKVRLAQFDDDRLVGKLFDLPENIFQSLRLAGPLNGKHALMAQMAIAVDILLVAPMRLDNLTRLNMDTHLHWHGVGRQRALRIFIQAHEVNNRQDLDIPIPAETSRRIETYLKLYHPLLAPAGSPWLFPGRPASAAKASAGLSRQVSEFLMVQLGAEMNVHLFRHLVGKFWLRDHPGDYGTVKEVLGHKDINTTMRAYTCFEGETAFRHYQGQIIVRPSKPRKR
jgi:integrase